MKFRTRAIHVGSEPDATGAVVPPIYLSTTFVQPGPGDWGAFDYSRSGNPTRARVEKTIAELEGAAGSLAFSSGMAATHCAIGLLEAGSHIVAGCDMYGGTYRLLHKICSRNRISVTLVHADDSTAIAEAIGPETKMVWVESIGNPLMSVPDLEQIAQITQKAGVLLAVDSTFVPPCILKPLDLGADIVMHSATKYFGGHSDCLAGALSAKTPELHRQLYFIQNATGGVIGGLEAFLLHRGIKTMELRVREQSKSALMIARWLQEHRSVRRVLYPGLESHPHHQRAVRLMGDQFGGMVTFDVRGDIETAKRVCKATELFGLAVSCGAVESLIEQPATMSHASYDPAARAQAGISDTLVRISVGLEDPEDLIADLERALAVAGGA
ncbi:MAG: PLP-dependent aspartate aminotransferase family protein [Planctomycetota bacterium]|nr:PLP-dependent aspartate aminotransferase family protein [Planctomycetota bacterium]